MQESAKSPQITQLLTRGTHHLELFTITLCKPVSGRTRTSQPEPQLPLHGALQEPRRRQVRESPGQSLVGRQSSLLAGVSTGHASTVWLSGDRPSSQDPRNHPLPHPHPAGRGRACDGLTSRHLAPQKKIKKGPFRLSWCCKKLGRER